MDNPRPGDFTRLEKGQQGGNYKLYDLGVSLNTNFLCFNQNLRKDLKTPYVDAVKYRWFSTPNFRRAMALALDQSKMGRLAFQGQAVPNWGPTTRGNRLWFDSQVKQYGYDPGRARALLAGEGFIDRNHDGWLEDARGNRVQFSLITNTGNTVREAMANLVKNDLKKIGVDVTVTLLDFGQLMNRLRETRDFDCVLLGFQSGVPADPAMGQNVWRSTGKYHQWCLDMPRPATPWEAEIDSLMDQLVRIDDYARRKRMWDRVQEIVTDQVPFIYLPTQKAYVVARNSFGNLRPTLLPHRVLWNSEQIYVLKR